MHICYLDESGTPEPGGTTHFVLLGLALPVFQWKQRDAEIARLKIKHRLEGVEVHTAWMMRRYGEQERIPNFETLSDVDRRASVQRERKADLAKASLGKSDAVKNLKKNYQKTAHYTHLTHSERRAAVQEIADAIGTWPELRLFADAQQKLAHVGTPQQLFSHAFEQVVTRFQHFLKAVGGHAVGLLVQDNNQTAANHLTALMRNFHAQGTKWSSINQIIETPLFVDSALTSMVQLADLCSYAVRRFFESNEVDLFDRIYQRFDRLPTTGKLVGLRHYTGKTNCNCRVCVDHGR
jgi:hypothetical protein